MSSRNTSANSKLVHKIKILKNQSASAIIEPNWQLVFEVYASVNAIVDKRYILLEGVSFGNVIGEEYYSFRTRYMKGITTDMRIFFKEFLFDIKRIMNEEHKDRWLNIIALRV